MQQQLVDRIYAVACLPENYLLFDAQAGLRVNIPETTDPGLRFQQLLFEGLLQSGYFDDHLKSSRPEWQSAGPLDWVQDFAIMGLRASGRESNGTGSQLLALATWMQLPLNLEAYTAAI